MPLLVGLDIGSTTTKTYVMDENFSELFWSYKRHGARQASSARKALQEVSERFPGEPLRISVTGSGARGIAQAIGGSYIQEVVANSLAIQRLYPEVRCAIELGGQDAKMIFFSEGDDGSAQVSDMRMNGSCAGGTGAFIDEMAKLLGADAESGEFEGLASRGTTVHEVSGRCGVYAKTNIQPLLNQGIPVEDLALSALHAVARQTIGGLAQGIDIEPPVIFEGGALAYNPTLVRVFKEQLGLSDDQVVIPKNPQVIVAMGAAISCAGMFADAEAVDLPAALSELDLLDGCAAPEGDGRLSAPFFKDADDRAAFDRRHPAEQPAPGPGAYAPGETVHAALGVDSGSTTTKFALVDADGNLIDSFYASNEGHPLDIAKQGLADLRRRWAEAGVGLTIDALGTTGYGEELFARAFHADYRTVETVAHARAASLAEPDATFVLDIGGQDMKAIWLDRGVLTDIVVNEACSAGCGSFLENFAKNFGIAVEDIAERSFASREPAALGSRCTVFMNSSVVSEQRRGKNPDDIMAGLRRSIIENVFTKVIRVSNLNRLGSRVVVQGGTFKNDAVLRAFEQYLGKTVVRAPHPGLMGAIGIALLAREKLAEGAPSAFIGLEAASRLEHREFTGVVCPRCGNRCRRAVVAFGDGTLYATGNRCPRGAAISAAELAEAAPEAAAFLGKPSEERSASPAALKVASAPNLFEERERLLFQDWPCEPVCERRGVTIGIPRVLEFWDTMPFWSVLFRALGFDVRISRKSTRRLYESGLAHVTSDTVCFPAKLVHGHVRDLANAGVDRIFMPIITTVPSENTAKTSEWMCAVVKGYPYVMRNSDNPEERFGVPFDAPLFHWYDVRDRNRQLKSWLKETFSIDPGDARRAIDAADGAQNAFAARMQERGREVIEDARGRGGYAVVIASRPYHNDPLVNHGLPRLFSERGIPVLTPDAVPGVMDVDLSRSRIDIVNNYHARMLSAAVIASSTPELELVQMGSFGCGHDAYLTDEIARMMAEMGTKTPMMIKLDESDVEGPMGIRVRSFIESIERRRAEERREGGQAPAARPLKDPYPVKYTDRCRKEKVVLVPNTSHAFCRLMTAAMRTQGIRAVALEPGREEAIRLGKRYVHNDICFPAQIVIGEALAALESGEYDPHEVAVVTGKYIGDCRLTHYLPLLRRALDDAGYDYVPVLDNDDVDAHNVHPGFKLSLGSSVKIAFGLPMIDALEAILRRTRPYELEPGSADAAFSRAMDELIGGMERSGLRGLDRGFARALRIMGSVAVDRSTPRPTVLIVGEYLLNFHPGANHEVERYLEANGLEVIEARMTDVIRKTYFYKHAQSREFHVDIAPKDKAWYAVADRLFDIAHDHCDKLGRASDLYEAPVRMPELVRASDEILHHTFDAGEGVLIPAEILEHAARGCRNFLILQPFGCLPNHVVGRGLVHALKERYPDAQFLPLDYDPDVSFANIENRLQMLIMNAKAQKAGDSDAQAS